MLRLQSMLSETRAYVLVAATIFVSAFLLFEIQLIAGKVLLPWFGGSSSVWATSMLFFTTALFCGYFYVFRITQFPLERQIRIHRILIFAGCAIALIALFFWRSVMPALDWTIESSLPPALKTLGALLFGVGLPYFVLSTTGPLIQYWYGLTAGKEPYKLYVLSNAGSLIALVSYPFVIEPLSRLSVQESVWTILFLMCAGLLLFVARYTLDKAPTIAAPSEESSASPGLLRAFWILCAAFPGFLLVATTTAITQTIAPLPLLWIVPLSLYLLSFIIAFAGFRSSHLVPLALLLSTGASWWFIDPVITEVKWKILADLSVLFFASLHVHAHLYRTRPSPAELPRFYMLLSLGGAIGTFLASIVAPLVFNDYYEFGIGLALAAASALYIVPAPFPLRSERIFVRMATTTLVSFALTIIVYGFYEYAHDRTEGYLLVSRNFYGTVKVEETSIMRALSHGSTLHGLQLLAPGEEFKPVSYYAPESGIGRAFAYARARNGEEGMSVGILGLGAGMTAGYCKAGDRFVFYEIDPRIQEIAREQFTFLSRCPQAEVREGDGRILLESEYRRGEKGNYDVVMADAFNDDTIPVHLITREAVLRYVSHLRDERGIVAVHISNRYLDLLPVLEAIARDTGLALLNVHYQGTVASYSATSHWVLLSPSGETFTAPQFKDAASPLSGKMSLPWTDDHSDLISVIDL